MVHVNGCAKPRGSSASPRPPREPATYAIKSTLPRQGIICGDVLLLSSPPVVCFCLRLVSCGGVFPQEVRQIKGTFYITDHYFAFVGTKAVDLSHLELNRQFRDVMRHDEVITIKRHTKSTKALVFTDIGQVRSDQITSGLLRHIGTLLLLLLHCLLLLGDSLLVPNTHKAAINCSDTGT